MTNPDRLALSVEHADGTVTRWGPDEPQPTDIPGDLRFTTSIPGGFKDLSCSLLRRIDIDYRDQVIFDTVRVYAPGNRTVWEGRMEQFPRSHGQSFQIVPGAIGWSAHLQDFPAFREVYVDRDVTSWAEADLARRQALTGSSFILGKFAVTLGNGGISWDVTTDALPSGCIAEIYYIPPAGILIARLGYKGKRIGTFTNFETPTAFGASSSALTLDDTVRSVSLTPFGQVMLRLTNTPGVTPATSLQQSYSKIAVYGNHGLTTRAISGEPDGLYASDVIQNIVTRAAPLLSIPAGAIDATTFAIPHLVFSDPTTPFDAISTVNAFHLYDWGVYDDRGFFFRAPDPDRLTWQCRLSSGAQIDFEGETGSQVFNGVIVRYTDPLGRQRVVGPPAASWPSATALADATDASLVDSTATNPATANGIARKWGILDIGFVTTDAGAIALGAVWLAEHSLPQRRGTLKLTGTVTHPTEGNVPVWRVRAGDYITIADHPADVARRIIDATYTHQDRTIACSLDNTSHKLDAILERIGVQLVGVL